jgi:DNA-binding transcriptional LysR family regulator
MSLQAIAVFNIAMAPTAAFRSGNSTATASPRHLSVDGRVIVNSADFAVRAAADGLGIAYAVEPLVQPLLRSGQLIRILEKCSPSIPGLFLYLPGSSASPGGAARAHRYDSAFAAPASASRSYNWLREAQVDLEAMNNALCIFQ